MEEMMKNELVVRLQDVFDDVKMSSTLLEAGKEVFAHRQLQGVRKKLSDVIIELIKGGVPSSVVEENTPTE